jgi:hypothetical protein
VTFPAVPTFTDVNEFVVEEGAVAGTVRLPSPPHEARADKVVRVRKRPRVRVDRVTGDLHWVWKARRGLYRSAGA